MSTIKTRKRESSRLDPTAWVEAALELLAAEGIKGVRIEVLAKRLGVTKGSFYWHFKDRRALYDEMLSHWRRHATLGLIERLNRKEEDPQARFRRLIRIPVTGKAGSLAADVSLAIRLWGTTDEAAHRTLKEVEDLRLHYVAGLLRECGLPDDEIEPRAILAYSYMRVAETLVPKNAEALLRKCENVLLGIPAAD